MEQPAHYLYLQMFLTDYLCKCIKRKEETKQKKNTEIFNKVSSALKMLTQNECFQKDRIFLWLFNTLKHVTKIYCVKGQGETMKVRSCTIKPLSV